MAFLHEDVSNKEEVLLENLKKELKTTVMEVYRNRTKGDGHLLESYKIMFMRAMEEAWLTNAIIKERCVTSRLVDTHDPSSFHLMRKAVDYNRKIRWAMSLGLEGIILGPSHKPDQEEEEKHEVEELELKDLKMSIEEEVLETVPEHKEEVAKHLQYFYRRACRFAKLESRVECLASIVNSLLERERESEREATENEILGYLLLQETADSSLKFPHMLISRGQSMKIPNSIKLLSSFEEGDEKIVVEVPKEILTQHASDKPNYETTSANKIDYYGMKDMEQIMSELSKGKALILKGKEELEIHDRVLSQAAAERQFETKLIAHYEDLSDIWLARCLNPVSETEAKQLEEIAHLARKAMDNYTQDAKKAIPTITLPILPSFRP